MPAERTLSPGLIDVKHSLEDRTHRMIDGCGPAQLWYLRLEVNSGASPWQSFVRIVQNHFGPPMTDTPLGALELLQRTTTVEDYCGKFMALGSIPPKSVAMIWCGLSWELRTDIWEDRHILWAGIDRDAAPPACHSIAARDDTLLDNLISHRIRLQAGTDAVVVRLYRYAHVQKDELERQCNELHCQGLSAFSSPALLVRKHDSSRHLCFDNRALNTKTIKDKFPIPVVEELLDELRGTRYSTKLDLHSGYH
ncbi:hypothetical protein U9M48_031766 [Paspalum notatum var. saurae]|uniref:Retrotransposon gag domain-containing protein n=1 Tax=Paspalum notatum var. saurae TaxID=547442 RepID=A0AAQ3X4R2_PASNO